MIAVVQRVSSAHVTIDDPPHHDAIEHGLLVLLGVEEGDTEAGAEWMATKLTRLRIFRDDDDRMNRSVIDVGGGMLIVSQFTLLGDATKGHRPSFIKAAMPELGQRLYDVVVNQLRAIEALPVGTGVFGAMMQVGLVNDGPVTLIVNTPASLQTRA